MGISGTLGDLPAPPPPRYLPYDQMSVKELKAELVSHSINGSQFVEKSEMVAALQLAADARGEY